MPAEVRAFLLQAVGWKNPEGWWSTPGWQGVERVSDGDELRTGCRRSCFLAVKPRETVWELKPHSLGKHLVLKQYLKAWLPILGQTQGRIIFLDGFAGPGEYKGGEEGSPIIALRAFVEHSAARQIKAEVKFTEEPRPVLRDGRSIRGFRYSDAPHRTDPGSRQERGLHLRHVRTYQSIPRQRRVPRSAGPTLRLR
ncbi:MAG: three-Cys-motif partner protein TcmP [Gemmatimonadales bacterium]|nr:three-Cys-motif partner protein TcmP [Gemmatimonadales bacterium]MYC89787.1 three-Cys-motif partner protein TcmP [Candidatus Palauibacter denitrificans]